MYLSSDKIKWRHQFWRKLTTIKHLLTIGLLQLNKTITRQIYSFFENSEIISINFVSFDKNMGKNKLKPTEIRCQNFWKASLAFPHPYIIWWNGRHNGKYMKEKNKQTPRHHTSIWWETKLNSATLSGWL